MRPAHRGGRQKIVPNSLRLPYFASYFFSFFFSQSRRACLSAGRPQRNARLLTIFCFGEISIYCSRGAISFFCAGSCGPLGLASGGLGGLATLRAIFFFVQRRRACLSADRPQRNNSQFFAPYLLWSLPRRIAGPPRRIFFLQRRRDLSAEVGAKKLWSARFDFRR